MSPILKNIIFGILLIVIILIIIHFFKKSNSNLSGLNPGNKVVTIQSSDITSNKNSNNYAYSIWFYVSDWQYRLSSEKSLLERKSNGGSSSSNPHIYLASYTNDIHIKVETVGGNNKSNNDCSIRNFPLQRWVNLIVSLNGRTLDVYLDGKLVRTCILPGVAKPIGDSDIKITPGGGFDGWTSALKYWAQPLNPQEAYNVYKEGPGGSTLTNIFEKYKLKITYLVDNIDQGSISI